MSKKTMSPGRDSSAVTRTKSPGHVLLTAALLSEIITGGHAFSMPVGVTLTPLQRIHGRSRGESSPICDEQTNINININIHSSHKRGKKPLFAVQYYDDEDQWGDDADYVNEQQADLNDDAFQYNEYNEQRNYVGSKQAILGGAALGTVMAINNAVGMSVGAETAIPAAPTSSGEISEQSYSAAVYAKQEATLPYLEKQIQAAEQALVDHAYSYESSTSVLGSAESATVASASASNVAATLTSETNAAFSPSFIRYTQEHMPGWIETGHNIYDAAAPKVVAGGKNIIAEVDKRLTPIVIEKEHELLGEANSAVLDNTLSTVASAGKMVAGMIGKVVTFGIEEGIQVAKAAPEVIAAGQQMYKTVDKKIIPEVVDTGRKMKMIVDKTVPEVMDTGKHAYDTIMPEIVNAENQVASTVKSGVDKAMPTVREIENKIVPELSKFERDVLGKERAAMVDKTVAEVAQQGQDVFQTAERTIPQVWASGQKTVDNVAYTGRAVARAVPVIVETGKQAYNSVDRGVSDAIATTQDIASDLDRAAGKTAYAIEDNLNGVTGTIDKTLPALLEVGRQAAVSGSELASAVEYLYEDVSGFVDDLKVDNTINSAGKRFASTKPTFREITASVNDPNQLGKL